MFNCINSSKKRLFLIKQNFFSSKFSLEGFNNFLRIKNKDCGDHFDFHYIWLRHNCRCLNGCVNSKSNEKVTSTTDFPMNIYPISYSVNTSDKLIIEWSQGNHKTIYDIKNLIDSSYSKNRVLAAEPYIKLSDIIVNFKDYGSSSIEYLKKVKLTLNKYAACIVKNRGTDIEEIISEFGGNVYYSHFGRYEDLKTNNTTNQNNDQLGYTNASVGLHTDLAFIEEPPKYQLLQCLTPAETGGENYFTNLNFLMKYLKQIDYEAFRIITTYPVTFDRKQKNYSSKVTAPIITLSGEDSNGHPIVKIARFSYFTYAPFNFSFDEMESFYRAHNIFTELCNKFRYQTKLERGDFVIYNNHLNLHARTAFEGDRHLRGVYFSEDDLTKFWQEKNI